MTLEPQLVIPWAIAAASAAIGIAALVVLLALDRARRAEIRAIYYRALLDKHDIPYPEPKE